MKSLAQIFNEEALANGQLATIENSNPKMVDATRRDIANFAADKTDEIKVLYSSAVKVDLKSAKLPDRLKIMNWGRTESTKGPFIVGPKTAALSAIKNGYERVAIDFDHCTVPGTDSHAELIKAGQPPLIFGYGRVNIMPGEGIFLEEINWTPLGVQHAKNFEDLSPALGDKSGEVDFIHSVALCANGCMFDAPTFHNQLAVLSASRPPQGQAAKQINLAEIFNRENAAPLRGLSASGTGAPAIRSNDSSIEILAERDYFIERLSARLDNAVKLFSSEGKAPKKENGQIYTSTELRQLKIEDMQLLYATTPSNRGTRDRNAFRDVNGQIDMAALFDAENLLRDLK